MFTVPSEAMGPEGIIRIMSRRLSAKKPNVYYAEGEGFELPIIDVTNPEFALSVGPAQQREIVEAFLRSRRPYRFLPRWLRRKLFDSMAKRSMLVRTLRDRGCQPYLSGLNTYLLKLSGRTISAR